MTYIWWNGNKGGFLATDDNGWPVLKRNPFDAAVSRFSTRDAAEKFVAAKVSDESRIQNLALIQFQRMDNIPYEGASVDRITAIAQES